MIQPEECDHPASAPSSEDACGYLKENSELFLRPGLQELNRLDHQLPYRGIAFHRLPPQPFVQLRGYGAVQVINDN